MDKESPQDFSEIEDGQAGLRDSIARAKELAEESDRLIRRSHGDDKDSVR